MTEYPSNNREVKAVPTESDKREIPRVVVDNTKVIRAKKTLGRRMKETFVVADPKIVMAQVVEKVLLPAFKDTAIDAFTETVNRMFGGKKTTGRIVKETIGPIVTNYSRFSNTRPADTRPPYPSKTRVDFDEVILEERDKAYNVLEVMGEIIDRYGSVSVRDFYEILSLPCNHQDSKFGWYDVQNARVRRVSNGFLIELPRPEQLG